MDAFAMVWTSAYNQNARQLPAGEQERIAWDATLELRRNYDFIISLNIPSKRRA